MTRLMTTTGSMLLGAFAIASAGGEPTATEQATTQQTAAKQTATEQAIAEVQKLGGSVSFDEESPCRVVPLQLMGATDAKLEYVKRLNQLTSLDLRGTQVTNAGLAELKKAFPNLDIRR